MKFCVFLSILICVLVFYGDHSYGSNNINPCISPNIGMTYSRQNRVRDIFNNRLDAVFYGKIITENRELYEVFERQGEQVEVFRDKITYKVIFGLKGAKNQSYVDVWKYYDLNRPAPQDDVLIKAIYDKQRNLIFRQRILTGNCSEMQKPITDQEFLKAYNRQRMLYFSFLGFCFVLIGFSTYPIFRFLKKRKSNGRAG